ncbi:MAG: TIGR04222 domain-containing membrane protein [Acidimicrobiia bacterium]
MTWLTVGLLGLMALGVTISSVANHRVIKGGARPSERVTFYQLAHLAGGRARVAEVAVAYLVWAGLVEARVNARTLALRAAPAASVELAPVEQALIATIPPEGGRPAIPMSAARDAARWVEGNLVGLVVAARQSWMVALPAMVSAVVAAVISVGVAWASEISVGFLPVVTVVAAIVVLTALPRGVRLTNAGKEVLDVERERFDPDLPIAQVGVTSLPIESGLYIVALYGNDAMTGELSPLRRILARG